jgi:ABC-type polysaccharide/polyol phosphate transport system ATPase subunit
VIEVNDVSKLFRIWEDRSRDLKETAINFLRGKKRTFRDLWALRGIDVKIMEGETVAFIGENGSGKSTLLKLLGGIYAPDEGKIVTRGKISTLLELGVGFHPDLTGEENVYLNGAMLGFDRAEMRERFDEIVSFSEIGDFIYSPIRTYSSGMLMRLGFSVAMCVNPDILLLDEVLAVGDEAFQNKCFERLETFKTSGKTIVLVTHSMETVEKFCERAVLLHGGKVVIDGDPEEVVDEYYNLLSRRGKHTSSEMAEKEEGKPLADEEEIDATEAGAFVSPSLNGCDEKRENSEEQERTALQERPIEEGNGVAQSASALPTMIVQEMKITDPKGMEKESFHMGETVEIRIVVETPDGGEPAVGIGILRSDEVPVYGISNLIDHVRPSKIGDRRYSFLCEFPFLKLLPGNYIVRGHCGDVSGKRLFHTMEKSLVILGKTKEFGVCRLKHRWKALHD